MSLKGNSIVAQSGGPTAVINASARGVIEEAFKHSQIEGVYAAYDGILGVLNDEIFDMSKEDPEVIKGLSSTPASALGSCRHKVKTDEDVQKILEVFKKHNIRYFFYIGGNDSQDTADKVKKLAEKEGYEMRVMGVPKTIDNDLFGTDHCPGYGSVIKYLAAITMESGRDTEALWTHDTVSVIEAMGRNTGWIAAGTSLAKRDDEDAPNIILFPEVPFEIDKFANKVKETLKNYKRCVIVVSEGTKHTDGTYIAEQKGDFAKDSFGHKQLGGAGFYIKNLVEKEVGEKARFVIPSIAQRNGIHFASKTDSDEAYLVGQAAVQKAVEGMSGFMTAIKRLSDDPYKIEIDTVELSKVANGESLLPRDWITEEGFFVTKKYLDYARPLIQGEVPINIKDGLPVFSRFKKHFI